jgi:hypothetical protein
LNQVSNTKTCSDGFASSDMQVQSSAVIHCPNSRIPESGSGRDTFVIYSLGYNILQRGRGQATGVLWLLGTPYQGSSAGTGEP